MTKSRVWHVMVKMPSESWFISTTRYRESDAEDYALDLFERWPDLGVMIAERRGWFDHRGVWVDADG